MIALGIAVYVIGWLTTATVIAWTNLSKHGTKRIDADDGIVALFMSIS